ncbi:cytochrome bc complex cytochrome b subunit [Microbacterium sp. CIAB417]|uniref:cytochrome bc1 complex cytochrome b subunit n=1 Tax=Microbacterium sp. CIAB417 TaxID=2860287 RepID=UPI001FAC72DF|nr:cytochrome b N-terminal domain-containing protein [Microbacterium sp. CIAB417]
MIRSEHRGTQRIDQLAQWWEHRTGQGTRVLAWRQRVVPDHWSLLFGQIAVASLVVCILTGVFLMLFYTPSPETVRYQGIYEPLRGIEMSRALESTLAISFEIRGGLLMRQLHHWSSSAMVAAVMLHLLRLFFTAAFRRPRELTWLLWFGVLLVTMAAGLTGHLLPGDALSGTSLMVMDGLLKAVPVLGTWLSFLVFQGRFPSGAIETFYPLHVIVLPAVTVLMIVAIGLLHVVQRPAQFPGPGRTEHTVVGRPVTVAAVRSGGLFAVVFGALTVIAATVTVNPIWLYGPSDPAVASAGGGALWYLAALDGAQRLVPPGWEVVLFGRTWTIAVLVPIGLVTLFFLTAMIYPFIERWITGERKDQHWLARPRNAPTRTGLGVAGIVFYGVLWTAGGSDVIALHLSLSNEGLIMVLRAALFLGPVVAFLLTKRVCLGLQRRDRDILLHGYETGRIVRLPGGRYVEVHAPVSSYERWRLLDHESPMPAMVRPDAHGRIRWSERARARLSRWFFEDRILPVTTSVSGSPPPEAPRDIATMPAEHR